MCSLVAYWIYPMKIRLEETYGGFPVWSDTFENSFAICNRNFEPCCLVHWIDIFHWLSWSEGESENLIIAWKNLFDELQSLGEIVHFLYIYMGNDMILTSFLNQTFINMRCSTKWLYTIILTVYYHSVWIFCS